MEQWSELQKTKEKSIDETMEETIEKSIEFRTNLILEKLQGIHKDVVVIALDGKCASGKTTLAEKICQLTGAGIIHMDDFFLPIPLRFQERLDTPGGNVHYERFIEEVIPNLRSIRDFEYGRFDCSRMELGEMRSVKGGQLYLVEGSYSCHPIFGAYMDLKIFSTINSMEQLNRIEKRNGQDGLKNFVEKWIPMEEQYFQAYKICENADLIL